MSFAPGAEDNGKIDIDELVAYDYASEVAARDGSSIKELEVWVKHRRFGKK